MRKIEQSKVNLFMIEAAILLLIFSITSSSIVSIFIKANDMRVKANKLNEAVIYAQNIIEGLGSDVDQSYLNATSLEAEIDKVSKKIGIGTMDYYTIKIMDRYTKEIIYEIETGIYSGKEK